MRPSPTYSAAASRRRPPALLPPFNPPTSPPTAPTGNGGVDRRHGVGGGRRPQRSGVHDFAPAASHRFGRWRRGCVVNYATAADARAVFFRDRRAHRRAGQDRADFTIAMRRVSQHRAGIR